MATAAKASATRITNLSNGLIVATDENATSGAATVGVWIDAGSRNETANGTANFLEHVAIKVIKKHTDTKKKMPWNRIERYKKNNLEKKKVKYR